MWKTGNFMKSVRLYIQGNQCSAEMRSLLGLEKTFNLQEVQIDKRDSRQCTIGIY